VHEGHLALIVDGLEDAGVAGLVELPPALRPDQDAALIPPVIAEHHGINIMDTDIFYDFEFCTIQGNITGRVNDGNIDLKTFNSRYTRNNNWNFTIETGDINLNMTHNKDSIDLGANITSITTLNDGSALFIYEDNSANIGARFEIPFGNQTPRTFFPDCLRGPLQNCFLDGFHYNEPVLPEPGFPAEGDIIFTSFDLFNKQVMNYYDFLFIIDEGDFYMILTSIN